MILETFYKNVDNWNEKISESEEYPRHWRTTIEINIKLSNNYILNIPKGTIWDGASIPKYFWWIFKPIDKGAIGDLIHDILWLDKENQLKLFDYNVFLTRKFADQERLNIRNILEPSKKFKNYFTHYIIRLIGGFFYSRQLQIPK